MIHRRCLTCRKLKLEKVKYDDRGHGFGGIIGSGEAEYSCPRKPGVPVIKGETARKEWCVSWEGPFGAGRYDG